MAFSVDFLSDMHVDMRGGRPYDYAANKKHDIAIVAGDLTMDAASSIEELKKIAAVYETVLFIEGNHEFKKANFKDRNFNLQDVEDELRLGISGIPNVSYLKDSVFIKDGVAIIGRNGHCDYTLSGHIGREAAMQRHAEHLDRTEKAADGTFEGLAEAFRRQAEQDFEDLKNLVIQLNDNSEIHTIVIVTHSVPHIDTMRMGVEIDEDFLQKNAVPVSAMGNGRMKEIQGYDANGKIKYWLFGHQHFSCDTEIEGIEYKAHPRGAWKEVRPYSPLRQEFNRVAPRSRGCNPKTSPSCAPGLKP